MSKKWTAVLTLAAITAAPVALAQNAATVIENATRAMGSGDLSSITYYGSGANFNLGQNNNANQAWPRVNVNDYRRTIDFTRPASLATGKTYAVPVTGGPAVLADFTQNIQPNAGGWLNQMEIWITPWGFLKGAAANNATTRTRNVNGQRYTVVTWNAPMQSPSGQPYRVVGYINRDNLVERVETWVENPIFGDMHVEVTYEQYRDKDGLKYPTTIVQKRGGWPTFEAQILGANANPSNLQALMTPPQRPGGGPGGPAGGQPPAHQAERLADGVWRITGGYVALAVEFNDYILVYEPAGQNEQRAASLLETVKRTIPGKPIRYGVLSHHHFDHTSGLPAVVAEGITIVTHEVNREFLESTLNGPHTLGNDAIQRSGRRAVIETVGDKHVFTDGNQTVELHLIKGLPHADGMLVAYLPAHGIVAYADMFNLPPADDPVPNPPVVGTQVFADNMERLGLNWDRLVTVHAPNPDRPFGRREVLASLGRQ